MNNDAYSPYKAVHHEEVINAIRFNSENITPPHVQLILSDLCNHNCSFCAYRTPGYTSAQKFYTVNKKLTGNVIRDRKNPQHNYNPKRWIPENRVLSLIDELDAANVMAVQLTGGGEPTVHPMFKQVIERLRKLHMEYAVVTNGSLIDKRDLYAELVGASWVRVSVDAGTPRTYSVTRGTKPRAFMELWETIRKLRDARDKAGSGCVIGVGFVVTDKNWQEITEAVDLARRYGADNIRISAMFSPEGSAPFKKNYPAILRECQAAERMGTYSFQVFARFTDRIEDLELTSPDYQRCLYQHFTTYIGADLNVYRCCVYSYNDRGLIGEVRTKTFKEMWENAERRDEMEAFDATKCERCQFNKINRFINYVCARKEPLHANFV